MNTVPTLGSLSMLQTRGFRKKYTRYLSHPGAFLAYHNKAVIPIYILHQTVMVLLALYVVKLEFPVTVKFLILLAGTLKITRLIYELLFQRVRLMRLLLGMNPKLDPMI